MADPVNPLQALSFALEHAEICRRLCIQPSTRAAAVADHHRPKRMRRATFEALRARLRELEEQAKQSQFAGCCAGEVAP